FASVSPLLLYHSPTLSSSACRLFLSHRPHFFSPMPEPSFLFPCDAALPSFCSFPTRPSSDPGHAYLVPGEAAAVSWCPTAAASRSEEHTSELQSLTNLVCRLLLEKKKSRS